MPEQELNFREKLSYLIAAAEHRDSSQVEKWEVDIVTEYELLEMALDRCEESY